LQDVHWSGGGFGSFPGYTIGNVMSAQVLAAAYQGIPNLAETLAEGNYLVLLDWLTEHIYQHGRAYNVNELLLRISGKELHVKPYMEYLNHKFGTLHEFSE
jgi:carboxypeptidase Taq